MTLLALLLALMMPVSPHFERGKQSLPYHARWRPYQIVVEQQGHDEDGRPQQVRILDNRGHTLRTVRAWAITRIETIRLTGRSPSELHIALWSGGAYANLTDVYFTRKGGLRNLLIFDGEDLGVRDIKDLNGDGIPEIITANPVLGDFSAFNFHRHFPVITILGWNGKKYVDVTRRYPRRSLREAQAHRRDIRDALQDPPAERREWNLQDLITAYYANMLVIGRRTEARDWLHRHLPPAEWV